MAINSASAYLSKSYDCLILVHPHIKVLERISDEFQELGIAHLNVSKALSASLMAVSTSERDRFSQECLIDSLSEFPNSPVLCTCPDLLFDPSLAVDPLALFRKAARVKKLIVCWPGDFSANTLSYAVPEHHHFRTWKISEDSLRQPEVLIQRLPNTQGA
ncbi:MAG: BREX-3 system P-loop-containing protein BrxF [Chloroflexi bacterium]|nr:BREX-3 system P-loop-containing protein BrxF [Chloroflexota bacterium]